MVSGEDTIILLDDELPGAQAWAKRCRTPLVWVPEGLEIRVTLTQPDSGELFYLRGRFDNYRAVAPAWVFTDAEWTAEPGPQFFPRPAPTPLGAPSVFHAQPVICAPFNRLAYKEHNGPHPDWGGPAQWLTAGVAGQVTAHYLGDMVSVIYQHFVVTRGRMG